MFEKRIFESIRSYPTELSKQICSRHFDNILIVVEMMFLADKNMENETCTQGKQR
jgi:hypothetical protein